MKIKQTVLTLLSLGVLVGGGLLVAQPVSATPSDPDKLNCSVLPQDICDAANDPGKNTIKTTGTWMLLRFALKILTALVGVVAVGALGWAGFLYATASNNANQVTKAKEMIRDVVIGLVAYAFMYVLLQFLIPGGVFT